MPLKPSLLLFCFVALYWYGAVEPGLATENHHSEALRVYYTANRQGELDPCHCQGDPLGGLARLQTFFQRDQGKDATTPSIWADAGDTFFLLPTLPVGEEAVARARATTIARAYREMRIDAMEPGERDFAAGLPFLRELQKLSGATFVSSNLADPSGKPLFAPWVMLTRGKVKLALLGVVDESAFSGVSGVKALPARDALEKSLAEVRAQHPTLVVLLSHLGLTTDREVAKRFGGDLDLIIGSHSQDILDKPERVGKTWIVQPQNQGQQAGRLDFVPDSRAWQGARLVNLGESFDAENSVAKLLREYRDGLRSLGQVGTADAKPGIGIKPFVANPRTCRSCHQVQYDFWIGTKHASAYLTLYAKNEHFDPSCISCHTLGYKQPGGFRKITAPIELSHSGPKGTLPVETLMSAIFAGDTRRPIDSHADPARFGKLHVRYLEEIDKLYRDPGVEHNYLGVQCEHCHGNRALHVASKRASTLEIHAVPVKKARAGLSGVSLETCRQCHRPPNAPQFDPTWKVRVACPRM